MGSEIATDKPWQGDGGPNMVALMGAHRGAYHKR